MRRLLVPTCLAVTGWIGIALTTHPAVAATAAFEVTLTCNGQSYDTLAQGWEFHIVGSIPRTNYVVTTQSYTDASGTHFLHNANAQPGGQVVTCTYIGPITGRLYTNTGFFTPAG
jgi:hypothetical protein